MFAVIEVDEINRAKLEEPKFGLSLTVTWPCGGHQEIKGMEPNGEFFFRVEVVPNTHCKDLYCYLQTGQWKTSEPHIAIVDKMIELGWKGPGEGYGKYYDQVPCELKIAVHDKCFCGNCCN